MTEREEPRVTHILAVVPTRGVEDTGAISGAFRLRAQVSAEQQLEPFGYLVVEPVRQLPAVAGKIACPSPDALVWHLVVVCPPRGPLVRNAKSESLLGLVAGLPDCVLLVDPGALEALRMVCSGLDYKMTVQEFHGQLRTH